jgi:hypothetical protein
MELCDRRPGFSLGNCLLLRGNERPFPSTLERGSNKFSASERSKANAHTTTETERQKKSVNGLVSNAFGNPVRILWKTTDDVPRNN